VLVILRVSAAASSLVMWRAYIAERDAREAETVRRQRTQGSLKFLFNVLGATYQSLLHIQPGTDPETKKEHEALIKRALSFYKEFTEENADDPTVRVEVARAYSFLAGMYKTLGDYEQAKQAYNQAFALIEQAAAENPSDLSIQAFLGAAYFTLPGYQADEGNFQEAVRLTARGIEILTQLPSDFLLADPQYRFWLASAYKSLAGHFKEAGRYGEAVENYQRASEVATELARDFPHDATFLHLQGLIHMDLGNALRGALRWEGGASDRESSRRSYLRAIQIQTQLAREFPEGFPGSSLVVVPFMHHAQFQSDLALSHHNLANLLRERDEELLEAEKHYRQAVDLWTQADRRLPNMAEYNWWLGMAHNNLGSLLTDKGERKEASEHIEEAVRLLKAVVKKSPKVVRFRDELASAFINLGNILEDEDRTDEAEKAYRDALRTCQDLLRDSPQVSQVGHPAISAFALARILMRTGRRQEAKDICHQAIALAEAAHEVELLNQLAWQMSICPDAELRQPARALELAKKTVQIAPDKADFWNTLGAAEYRVGNWKAALDAFEQSMKFSDGGDSSDWFFLAMIYWQLADKEQAGKFFQKAVVRMDRYRPQDKELRRFRAEAAALLGLEDSTPKGKEASSKKN
jgi:tetratricopeptide (TPR) repeat protein